MPFVRVGDITVHYRFDGPSERRSGAPVLLLVNGLGTDLHMWDEQVAPLAVDHHVLRYDVRGHGLTDVTPDDDPTAATITRLTDDAVGLLDAFSIARVAVVGISMGGMIAQRLAAEHPERVPALMLCATGNRLGTAEVWNARIEAVRCDGTESVAEATMRRWFTPRMHAARPEVIAGFANMVRRTPDAGYIAGAQAVRDADLRELDTRIRARTLIVYGTDDDSAPRSAAEAMRDAIPGARLHAEDAMHMLNVERPIAFDVLLRGLLEEPR